MRFHSIAIAAALLAGCGEEPPEVTPGVVEAEFVHVASLAAGKLVELAVQRGGEVAVGAPLFRIESPDDQAALAEAGARVAEAAAQLADLEKGRRPDEVAVTAAQVEQAKSALAQAEAQLRRERALVARGFVSPARIDTLVADRDEAAGRLRELQAQVRVAKLAGREDQRAAATAALANARGQEAQLRARLDDKAQRAPVAGIVDDTLFRPGETVAAGAPVVNLLPPAAIKVRFFVAEPMLARFKPGDVLNVRCDGCPAPVEVRVRSIAHSAEYTPPVIYSRDQRARLVYLVEAWPSEADAAKLRVGQPVDVVLPDGAK